MDVTALTDLLEALTIFCFGLSWPISIRKSIVSRTAKGKSFVFEIFLLVGYAFGIARKAIQLASLPVGGFLFWLSFVFYILNFMQICVDLGLYFRNSRLDREAEAAAAAAGKS